MEKKLVLMIPAAALLGVLILGCRPAAAYPPQAPTPPPTAYAPVPPPPDAVPPPPLPRAQRAAPPPCGPAPNVPPPSPGPYAQAVPSSMQGTIRQFNYGREGEVSGFVLSNGVQVNVPAELGEQVAAITKVRSEISVSGYRRQSTSGKPLFDATSATANGQSVTVPASPDGSAAPPPPPPPPGEQPPPPPQP
jgi:hypothetical protein